MRVVSAAVALTYGLAFLVVCLGGCVGVATAEEHACCKQAEGSAAVKAASADCCKVVSAVAGKLSTALAPTTAWTTYAAKAAVSHSASPPSLRVTVAASPPLILRV